MRRKVLLALSACVGTTMIWLAVSGASGQSPPTVGSDVARAFSVFKLPASEPAATVAAAVNHTPERLDLNDVKLAQSSASEEVRVIGGPSAVCVTAREPGFAVGSGCAPISSAADNRHPVLLSLPAPNHRLLVVGLVPDGTSGVTVIGSDGQLNIPVVNNTFSTVLTSPPTRVTWTAPDGSAQGQDVALDAR